MVAEELRQQSFGVVIKQQDIRLNSFNSFNFLICESSVRYKDFDLFIFPSANINSKVKSFKIQEVHASSTP